MNGVTLNDTMPFASLSIGEARTFMQGVVQNELERLSTITTPKPKEWPLVLNLDEVQAWLKSQGWPVTKSTLYKMTHQNEIPFRKLGKRLVFSTEDLSTWLQSKATVEDRSLNEALTLAASARRKK